MTFGQQIQSLRKGKGLSQDALAAMLYVTRQSVSQWENDKSMPSVDLLVRLSQIFDISVDELLGNNEQEEKPVAVGKILNDKKDIRLAASFRFASTVSLLVSVAIGVVIAFMFSSSIWETAYQGLKYRLQFTDILDRFAIFSVSVLLAGIFIVMRLVFQKRITVFSKQLSDLIEFYSDRLVFKDVNGEPIIYFFAVMKKIYENDQYFYLTLPGNQQIIIDKSALSNAEAVGKLLSTHNNYRKKFVVIKNKRQISPRKARMLLAVNNVVFVLSMILALCYLYIRSIIMTNEGLSAPLRWVLFLIPILAAILSVALGIIESMKKLKAKRLIFAGVSCLLFIGFLFTDAVSFFPVYSFNRHAVEPEEFLSLMEDNHFTVRQANREHLEDFLYECYEATDENGIKVIYMHFNEEVKNRAAYSAKTAYDGFVTDERNASNNRSHGNYMNLYLNNYYTHYSANGRYCYISQNRYTVIYISTESKSEKIVEKKFGDYKMPLPY